jgi:hypothetical protein
MVQTQQTDSQNNDTTAPSGRELYHLQFSLQAASPETFGHTVIYIGTSQIPCLQESYTVTESNKSYEFMYLGTK